jgi:hypothetical protein
VLGYDWDPNPATNAKMATLLTAELKTRLGWERSVTFSEG